MPLLKGAASDITVYRRTNATNSTDPEKKSRTFVAPNKYVIAPVVRTSGLTMPTFSSIVGPRTLLVSYTGADQTFVVPDTVTYIDVQLYGAGGASHGGGSYVNGGSGGYVSGRLPVTPGETLTLVVGGGGSGATGGYGGGGNGFDATGGNVPGGGGGRTAIRRGTDDIVTAGGGGGAGRGVSGRSGIGGNGGGLTGQDSQVDPAFPADATASLGKGGTQTAGGAGGTGVNNGSPGAKYTGGAGATGGDDDTGGGGGGWYGGGGGGDTSGQTWGGGGGGGSSYVVLLTNVVNTQGAGASGGRGVANDPQRAGGNGSCVINWLVPFKDFKSPPFNGRVYIT